MNPARAELPEPSPFHALAHEAPYLIEKLVKERIADSAAEGEALFREVVRFIVLVRLEPSIAWDMYSLRIDEAWHQFVLFTREYIAFCARYFGRYVQHSPSNAPMDEEPGEATAQPAPQPATLALFAERYRELFGEPPPPLWFDHTTIEPHRRVVNYQAGELAVLDEADGVSLVDAYGHAVLSVNELARPALAFIARTGAFYVRELPGDLTDEEKVALIATLVEQQLLRVAP